MQLDFTLMGMKNMILQELKAKRTKQTNKQNPLDLGWIREALPEERTLQLRAEECVVLTAEQGRNSTHRPWMWPIPGNERRPEKPEEMELEGR